ncbi:ileal sodium/bile acid cotransporter-like isoform X1 [Alosa sapidissima]|uniref:ileal sodium/bile acid cotransporter-like isoform X1 n=1 Tax=Alosa sapidissima TaxID=34773 RepID=UPI001C080CD7|nr:ileal sodium/bile acid cotransporter-like isoform X1 [Alosa sapidissima]
MLNSSIIEVGQVSNTTLDGLGTTLHQALNIILTILLAVVVFALGCTVEIGKVLTHVRRPWGILVGILCQFGVMPLTAFLLALTLNVRPVQAIAILIMGCCPGGTISNIITYWIDGDMDLSITMTSLSTILAMGMMPLCLLVYSRSWVETGSIRVPYIQIGITLVSLIVPVACGVFVNYKWPKAAKVILKVGSVVGCVLLMIVGVASALLYRGSWNTDAAMVIVGLIFPMIGFTAGFTIAILARQPWPRCRTIALETGAQNVQICTTVLQLSFSPQDLVQMFTFPLIYGSFQLTFGLLLITVYQIYKRISTCKSDGSVLPDQALQSCPSANSGQGEVNISFEPDLSVQSSSN